MRNKLTKIIQGIKNHTINGPVEIISDPKNVLNSKSIYNKVQCKHQVGHPFYILKSLIRSLGSIASNNGKTLRESLLFLNSRGTLDMKKNNNGNKYPVSIVKDSIPANKSAKVHNGNEVLKALAKDDICYNAKTRFYQFRGALSGLNSLRLPYGGCGPNSDDDDATPEFINQLAYWIILTENLVGFITKDHSSNPVVNVKSTDDKKHLKGRYWSGKSPITRRSNGKTKYKDDINAKPVNNTRFIQQIIKAEDPGLVYSNSKPVKNNYNKISFKTDTDSNHCTQQTSDEYSFTRNSMNHYDMYQYRLNFSNHGANDQSLYEVILTNTLPDIKKITSAILNMGRNPSYVRNSAYNTYKLNSHFYLTIAQNMQSSINPIVKDSVIVPSIFYKLYKHGFTVKNYRTNYKKLVVFGNGKYLKYRHGEPETIKMAVKDSHEVYFVEIPAHVYNNKMGWLKPIKRHNLKKHLENIRKNKLFLRYVTE